MEFQGAQGRVIRKARRTRGGRIPGTFQGAQRRATRKARRNRER